MSPLDKSKRQTDSKRSKKPPPIGGFQEKIPFSTPSSGLFQQKLRN